MILCTATSRFFHGYYDCHCYLPLCVSRGKQLWAAKLRRSNIGASAGAMKEVVRIVGQIRVLAGGRDPAARRIGLCPGRVDGMVRGQPRGTVFGLARNDRLADDLTAAELESLTEGGSARRFADFAWRMLDSWSRQRRVVAKAEHLPKGPNLRRLDYRIHLWLPIACHTKTICGSISIETRRAGVSLPKQFHTWAVEAKND
jgi:Transposase DDE domain group 1